MPPRWLPLLVGLLFTRGAEAEEARDLFSELVGEAAVRSGPVIPQVEGSIPLPDIAFHGVQGPIHTQGLVVTDKHFYVTGRWETASKRALFLRFDRSDPSTYEIVDITPVSRTGSENVQDHPGGFDYDGTYFWIPVAVSKANSATTVMRITHAPDLPLKEHVRQVAFRVADHVGAIACHQDQLYGANWDTKEIYVWNQAGTLIRRIPQSQFVGNNDQWRLAVQDWKFVGRHLLASGLDRFPGRNPAQRAVVDVLQAPTMQQVLKLQFPDVKPATRPLTNEGMAWYEGSLFLLPEDLGRGARVWKFSF